MKYQPKKEETKNFISDPARSFFIASFANTLTATQADYLKMYSIYCNNQDLALQTYRQQMKDNEKFRTFVQVRVASYLLCAR